MLSLSRPIRDGPNDVTSATLRKPTDVAAALDDLPAISLTADAVEIVRGAAVTDLDVELRIDGEPTLLIGPEPGALAREVLLETNQIADATFREGLSDWRAHGAASAKIVTGTNLDPMWTCEEGTTAYLNVDQRDGRPVELVYVCPVDGELIPLARPRVVIAFASVASHRCHVELILAAYDADRRPLQRTIAPAASVAGGRSIASYHRTVATLRPMPSAAFVRLALRVTPTERDAYLFFLRPWLGMSRQPAGPAWSPARFAPELTAALRRGDGRALVRTIGLPRGLVDGAAHNLVALDRITGRELKGSPILQQTLAKGSGGIDRLDGTTLIGWARAEDGQPPLVRLTVNGAPSVEARADSPRPDGGFGFRLRLPPEHCTGEIAVLSVSLADSRKPIGEAVEIVPACATPFDALQRYANRPLPAQLSPAASRRYASTRAWLAAFRGRRTGADPWLDRQAEQLGLLHELLIEGYARRKRYPAFALPETNAPTVSIVVPVHGQKALTYNCLAAIAFAYGRASYEVIVCDDGSPDDTATLGEVVENLRIVQNPAPLGFGGACTRGAAAARGEKIVFLNNDTEPAANWLDALLFAFERFEGVGVAGSKLIYPDGTLQEAGGIVWGSGNPWNYGRGRNSADPRFNYTRDADYVSGAALMIDRAIWQKVGGFSDEFRPAYFEDTDLCFKVREAGYRTLYVPQSEVFHFEGFSNGTIVQGEGLKRFQEVNRPKFKRRWAHAYRENGEDGRNVDLAKDRFVHLRGLVVDLDTPQPDRDAGSYAAIQEMRLMQSIGCKLSFLPLNYAYLGYATESLNRLGIETLYAPFYNTLQEVLAERGASFDFVYVTRYLAGRQIIPIVRQLAPHAKIIFVNADMHFLREIRAAVLSKDPTALSRARDTRETELAVSRDSDLTLSYSLTEHAILQSHNLDQTTVALCPWVVDVVRGTPAYDEREGLAFLGSYSHPPNAEAMAYFVTQVMPLLRNALPGVTLHIYGSGVTDALNALAADDVVIEGFAPTVAHVYNAHRVFVAPLQSGAGLKGKVVEGLAYGTPTVLSPVANEGTGARADVDVAVAETPQEYVEAIVALYQNETAWNEMANAARAQAAKLYSFERGRKLMREAFEKVELFTPAEVATLVSNRAR